VKKKRFFVEQITSVLQQVASAGGRRLSPGRDSEQTCYRWKKSYGGILPSAARELTLRTSHSAT
jgi:hypothetical protein